MSDPARRGRADVRRVHRLRAAHARRRCCRSRCSGGATSRVANVETFLMYGGMAVQGFFLTLFLQQVAGFSALEAGSAGLLPTGVMFLLSRRFGALADRHGPRWFMTIGPLLVAAGFLALLRLDATTSYVVDLDARAAALLARARRHRVAAHGDGARRRRRARRRHRIGGQQRASRAPSGLLATAAVGAVLAGFYADRLDTELAGRTLTPAAQSQVAAGARPRARPGRRRPRCRRPIARSSPRRCGTRAWRRSTSRRSSAAPCSCSPGCSEACCCATRAGPRRPRAAPAASSSERPRRPAAARRAPEPAAA